MTFVIITHVPHFIAQNKYFAYAPYVCEMNIWTQYADKVIIVAPKTVIEKTPLDIEYVHQNIEFVAIDSFDLLSLKAVFLAIIKTPKISWQIYSAMKKAEHIHLRCPGNVGLLGTIVQMLFPNKPKTAKYAGNWDPKSKQPWSYRLQKWILGNMFLTRNMQVLVYGEWESRTNNIKPFFTASYLEKEKLPICGRNFKERINFVFVGTLVKGKNPSYAIQLVEALFQKGYDVYLELYGEGPERIALESYIEKKGLEKNITLKGNQTQETIKEAYQCSHFVVLPSESEGWPKAIAEGMFWGCVPVSTPISCVPFMLDYGGRGVLLDMNLDKDVNQLEAVLKNESDFGRIRKNASDWSRTYTLDFFETEIKKILQS